MMVNRMQGEYLVRPGWGTDTITLNVFFNDRSDGTSIIIDQIHYKVINHPTPVFFIEGLDDKGRISKQDLINSIIQVKAPHTLFKAKYKFNFWIYVNGNHSPGWGEISYSKAPYIGNNRLFSGEMKEFIKNTDPGSSILIEGRASVVLPRNIPNIIYLQGLSIQLE